MEAYYRNETPFADKHIGAFAIDVKPTNPEASEEDKVKVKVRINLNGVFSVVSATLIEKSDEPPKEMEAGEADQRQRDSNGAPSEMETDQVKDPKEKEAAGTKRKTKQTEMPVLVESAAKVMAEVANLCSIEQAMAVADITEQERQDAKNAVEEYVYEMRDKLADSLAKYSAEEERGKLSSELRETEDWLYGDGEDLDKKAYTERLDRLHSLGQPIVERHREAQLRPRVLEDIGALLNRVRKGVAAYRAGDENYAHLALDDINKLDGQLTSKQAWFDEVVGKLNNTPPHCPPPVFVHQLRDESQAFDKMASRILNKPKPAPPVVEPPKSSSPPPPGEKKDDKVEPMNTDENPQQAAQPNPADAAKQPKAQAPLSGAGVDEEPNEPPAGQNGTTADTTMEVE